MKINYINRSDIIFIFEAEKQLSSYVSAKYRWDNENNYDDIYLNLHLVKCIIIE
jgi:hypothetical protein